jgi:hypothetical protein
MGHSIRPLTKKVIEFLAMQHWQAGRADRARRRPGPENFPRRVAARPATPR